MANNLKGYKVFIASPGGLDEERKEFKQTIELYNKIEAIPRNVQFQAVGWEDTQPGMGRAQDIINKDLEQCDFFVMILHDRWGSSPGENNLNATSGTEEEYLFALKCFNNSDRPMKQIVCLFKSVPDNQFNDPGPQLQKVIDFRKKIQDEKKLLYSVFTSLREFEIILRTNLAAWLLNEGKASAPGLINPNSATITPDIFSDSHIERPSEPDPASDPVIEAILSNAWVLAKEGKLVEAEIEFTKAVVNDPGENQLLNYGNYLIKTGQLDKALMMIDRSIELTTSNDNNLANARAYNLKGNLLQTRGDLDGAEAMYNKSLAINEKLGLQEGMASNYGNLGILLKTRGDLDGAEAMYNKSLAIAERAGFKQIYDIVSGNLKILNDLKK
ncbi:MAG: tetratricopeptide repeat protein [Bacteroidota bacterium]